MRFPLALSSVLLAALLAAGCKKPVPPEEAFTPPAPVPTLPTPVVTKAPPPAPAAEALELETIYFDFDRADIRADQRAALLRSAEELRRNPRARIRIEGHCDERGTTDYNLALGQRRAEAARRFLVAQGVDPDRITTVSYGEEKPADPGHDELAWAKNRRAVFLTLEGSPAAVSDAE